MMDHTRATIKARNDHRMKRDAFKKSLVERLGRCPKFECNFWKKYNSNYDGAVSEITVEEGQFWNNEGPIRLYHAAKRFESNMSANYELSDNLPNALYNEDRIEELRGFSDENSEDFPEDFPEDSILGPYDDSEVDRKLNNKVDADSVVPELQRVGDKDSSFSSSSTDISFGANFQPDGFIQRSYQEDQEIEVLYDRLVHTSVLSSSFNTASEDLSHGNKFMDVKTAKSLNLYIDEYPQTSFFSLLDTLQSNNVIERIVIFRNRTSDGEMRTRFPEDIDNLFNVIQHLSETLVELVLWNFHEEDLSSFCKGMIKHRSIRHLQLHMEYGTLDQQTVETIASMPALISLELEVNDSFPVWSLLESDSLVLLGVAASTNYEFEANDILRLAARIRSNTTLRVLDLEPRIPSWCIGTVMASLQFSRTSRLETFRFSCRNSNQFQGDACMEEILNVIEYETPLRVLWNHSHESFFVSDAVRQKTMMAVSRNPSLEQFRLFAEKK